MPNNVLTHNLSEPLDGATMAKVEINAGDGNLTVDRLTTGESKLASGTLQYLENQGLPIQSVSSTNGQAKLTLRGGKASRPWLHLPWAACNGATEWLVHLNPTISSDITAHADGGNVKLDLGGMALTRLAADTGGGNVDVVLPDHAANLDVLAKTGAGNVTVELGSSVTGRSTINASSGAGNVVVRIPNGLAAKIHATSGLGKVIVNSPFVKIDRNTYQSSDYDRAANKVEITVKSGAGNASVDTK